MNVSTEPITDAKAAIAAAATTSFILTSRHGDR
jgi:hypothetical protein